MKRTTEQRLETLKEHAQYMQNMAALDQDFMQFDFEVLQDMYNNIDPRQTARIAALEAENARADTNIQNLERENRELRHDISKLKTRLIDEIGSYRAAAVFEGLRQSHK